MNIMRYTKPPKDWLEGLPIGNGRFAAMVWGDAGRDILDLNHEKLWRGVNRNRKAIPAAEYLPFVRSLLNEGDFIKGTLAANLFFAGNGGILPVKSRVDPYQTAGLLSFQLLDCVAFEWRSLDIENAIVSVSRKTPGGCVISEFFADCCDGPLMFRWHSSANFSGIFELSRVEDNEAEYSLNLNERAVTFDCLFKGGISYRIVCEFDTDGMCAIKNGRLVIDGAREIKCMVNITSDVFDSEDKTGRYTAKFNAFNQAREEHCRIFSQMMRRVELVLDEDMALDALSVEERLARLKDGRRDNGITALYYDFGRYLMASASICGDLPANAQGKWNHMIDPPWECDYHFNINLQMCYWMAEPCGMPECAEALLKYLERFYDSGREAAESLYGCRGIYLPIQTDMWGKSTPESFGWAAWIGAAPWLARCFWDHYTYSGDKDFLRDRGYKFFKQVALFYEDYLIEDENGILQVIPSQSPENAFKEAGGLLPVSIGVSSAMDVQLAFDALGYAIQSAEILDIDHDLAFKWKTMRTKLPGFRIGTDGRLLEWDRELTESELGHRHLSHLYGVFPSELFTPETRVEQYDAARKSLEFRLAHGGGHTGWSRAWTACLMSRFNDADGFYEHFIALIKDFATVSLLDLHPPRIFQIDGNLGAVMALTEAVISCVDNKVYLLRSLPAEWPSGSLSGIKIPGGHTVSVKWKEGRLLELQVTIGYAGSVTAYIPQYGEKRFTGVPGDTLAFCVND